MSKSAFRISGEAENDFQAVQPQEVETAPMQVGLIDGRTMHVRCDTDGLTRATVFMTETGAYLRAEERIYCLTPGVGGERYPGMTPGYSVEEKMDVMREDNMTAVPSRIALRRIVSAALARMDGDERVRAIYDNHDRQERLAALLADASADDLDTIITIITNAKERSTAAIAAE